MPPDDDFDAPESSSAGKLVRHIIDEMPGHVVVAFALVAFLFFHGMAASVLRLAGRDLTDLDFPLGIVSGAAGSLACTAWIVRVKYRKK